MVMFSMAFFYRVAHGRKKNYSDRFFSVIMDFSLDNPGFADSIASDQTQDAP